MDPSKKNREIIMVADEDLSSIGNHQTSTQARPMLPKGPRKPVRDDINKLFEAINIRTSKSLDLSSDHSSTGFYSKNASKRPMRVVPSYSPGIGFSEPVSLKQALRGLCISQAGEVAAKRLLKSPGSPRILESARNSSMHRSIAVETVQSGMIEFSLVPEESPSSSSDCPQENLKKPNARLGNQSFHSLPDSVIKPGMKIVESSLERKVHPSALTNSNSSHFEQASRESKVKSGSHNETPLPHYPCEPKEVSRIENDSVPAPVEVDVQSLEPAASQKENPTLNSVLQDQSFSYDSSKLNDSSISASSPKRKVGTSIKANQKLKRKTKLPTVSSSAAVKISKEGKSIRSTSRSMKPAIRNKNLAVKKQEQEQVIKGSNSQTLSEAISSSDYSSNQLICHNCQCSLNDIKKEPDKEFMAPSNNTKAGGVTTMDSSKQGYLSKGSANTVITASKGSKAPKVRGKGEFSQSSKSSIGEFSTSTSASDDSNVSRSSCGNRPHMSKDFKWEAINNARKQHGTLGLRHFNLLQKLGSGDIGTVYLAELLGTNCPFAIKVMDNEFLARRKKMPRARTEREILRMLDHPFLPTLYAQFTSGSLSCLVMEFCPGGDLHVLRQKQPGRCFPEQEARFYVAEVLLALEYLHMLGIVYRDLKPENILVREDGHIMLTDFDLSLRCSVNPTLVKSSSSSLGIEPPRISGPCAGSNCIDPFCAGPSCKVSCFTPRIFPSAAARTHKLKAAAEQAAAQKARSLPQLVAEPTEARSNSFVGTHEYLAPEIIKGEGHGSAVDWWTLGVFLYELLFGKTPFRGPGNEETLANVVLQNLRFPNTPIISFQARDLIRGLLVKEPENRLGTETGAAEIKRHPFFDGLNWALIRCAIPPQIPELCDVHVPNVTLQEKGQSYLECNAIGEHLEFELF